MSDMENKEKIASHAPRILIVEDEVHLAVGMRYSLEQEGYEVTVAHDGNTALAIIMKDKEFFDTFILDIMLPGMSGYALCEAIRSAGVQTPIMFLSVRALPEDRAKGFTIGANQYMTKPFELEEFIARVRNLLALQGLQKSHVTAEKKEAASDADLPLETRFKRAKPVEFGGARVDFETLEVDVRGRKSRLTSLEMMLLFYFVENEGRLIPKEELLMKVWKMPGDLHTRAPDQFILRLRKIFEPDPSNPVHFLTYRNSGYRFLKEPDRR
ncbi:MAG: response regulator transcription factor [Planctomycetia bacterium]|nr:response regulator transcription factor [Planctomycetia bacterium]